MERHRSVIRYILLLVLCLLATVGSILESAARESFSLWDVGYYLAILGALLSIRRLSSAGDQDTAGLSSHSGHALGSLLWLGLGLGLGTSQAGCGSAPMENLALAAPTSLAVGREAQATVVATYADGTVRDVTAAVTWTSEAPAIVKVTDEDSRKGRLRALAIGASTIRATLGGQSAAAEVFVSEAEPDVLFISPITMSVAKGTSLRLSASALYSDGSTRDVTDRVLWTSQDPSVARVSNDPDSAGLLLAQAEGTATLIASWSTGATARSLSANTQVTVGPPLLVNLSISAPSSALRIGGVLSLAAGSLYSDGSTPDVTDEVLWSSSDPDVLTLSNDDGSRGVATGRSDGVVQVTATLDGVIATFDLVVTP
ncbi:MAG: Ig-like domain-containing protein [Polyangia bacterium]